MKTLTPIDLGYCWTHDTVVYPPRNEYKNHYYSFDCDNGGPGQDDSCHVLQCLAMSRLC